MTERPAKGQRGFLLYSPFTETYFFRVYDPEDKGKFTDYDLCAEDIEVEIVDGLTTLYEGGKRNRLDYTRRVLGTDGEKDDHSTKDKEARDVRDSAAGGG